jgi:hypothetical protein
LNKVGIIIALFVIGIVALIAYSTMSGKLYRVQVCMTYGGQSSCKIVTGKSEQSALRGGITNACADIASGVTATMGCEAATPTSVKWLK